MRIHGLFYLVVGGAVAFISYRLNPEKLVFFIWIGIAMACWGILKLVFTMFTGKSKKNTHHVPKPPKHIQKQNPALRYCHSCGTAVHAMSNFCHRCGQRLLHRR